MEAYDMTDLGEITYILGIHVKRDREAGRIELSQQRQIEDILERFGKADVRSVSTPALANDHLHKLDTPEIDVKSYQQAVGALMYPMLGLDPTLHTQSEYLAGTPQSRAKNTSGRSTESSGIWRGART